MDAPAFQNLDLACAKAGKDIAEKQPEELHKVVTDALSVLEEQGPCALFLFLQTHSKTRIAKTVSEKLYGFLEKNPRQRPLLSGAGLGDPLPALLKMANNLDELLLVKDLFRQALVYARYHARLVGDGEERNEVAP